MKAEGCKIAEGIRATGCGQLRTLDVGLRGCAVVCGLRVGTVTHAANSFLTSLGFWRLWAAKSGLRAAGCGLRVGAVGCQLIAEFQVWCTLNCRCGLPTLVVGRNGWGCALRAAVCGCGLQVGTVDYQLIAEASRLQTVNSGEGLLNDQFAEL